jgi:hypothetical protein
MTMGGDVSRIERLELSLRPFDWPFARERRGEINAYFDALRAQKPNLWNGRVLLMHACRFAAGTLHGAFFETDFASFAAWRDFGFPGGGVFNCFALGALQGSDHAYVAGVMGAHTVNAGRIYFPGGTPDLNDVIGERVDLSASVLREVAEETGLAAADFAIDPGWHCVRTGAVIALLKSMRAKESAEQLRSRIRAHIARDKEPELADAYIVRGLADLHPKMPDFMQLFFRSRWVGWEDAMSERTP